MLRQERHDAQSIGIGADPTLAVSARFVGSTARVAVRVVGSTARVAARIVGSTARDTARVAARVIRITARVTARVVGSTARVAKAARTGSVAERCYDQRGYCQGVGAKNGVWSAQ